jgi:hypothetical protein
VHIRVRQLQNEKPDLKIDVQLHFKTHLFTIFPISWAVSCAVGLKVSKSAATTRQFFNMVIKNAEFDDDLESVEIFQKS